MTCIQMAYQLEVYETSVLFIKQWHFHFLTQVLLQYIACEVGAAGRGFHLLLQPFSNVYIHKQNNDFCKKSDSLWTEVL